MKAKEIKELSQDALTTKLVEAKKAYNQAKLIHNITPMDNPIQLRKDRKVIARLTTELHNRQLNS